VPAEQPGLTTAVGDVAAPVDDGETPPDVSDVTMAAPNGDRGGHAKPSDGKGRNKKAERVATPAATAPASDNGAKPDGAEAHDPDAIAPTGVRRARRAAAVPEPTPPTTSTPPAVPLLPAGSTSREQLARDQAARAAAARATGLTRSGTVTEAVPAMPAAPPVRTLPVDPKGRPRRLTRRERRAMGRLRARKVKRVVRHLDAWSVLKISLVLYLCLFVTIMVAGVLLWNLAVSAGTITDIEGFIEDLFAFQSFRFEGEQIFEACLFGGLILVLVGSGLNVLLALLFNLISDLVGGIRVTVIEEETVRQPTR
jgi:Transmembrane domain of unknown function (DUF3566)